MATNSAQNRLLCCSRKLSVSENTAKINRNRVAKYSFVRAARTTVARTVITNTAANRPTPIQPTWTSRSIQPLWAVGTLQWVCLRTIIAGTEVLPQKAAKPNPSQGRRAT
jgi:hypothetical protein